MSVKKIFDKWFYVFAVFFYSIAALIIFDVIYNNGEMTYNDIQVDTNEYLFSLYVLLFFTFMTFLFSWGARTILSFYSNLIFGQNKSNKNQDV